MLMHVCLYWFRWLRKPEASDSIVVWIISSCEPPKWMLGTDLGALTKAVDALNHWAISPRPANILFTCAQEETWSAVFCVRMCPCLGVRAALASWNESAAYALPGLSWEQLEEWWRWFEDLVESSNKSLYGAFLCGHTFSSLSDSCCLCNCSRCWCPLDFM